MDKERDHMNILFIFDDVVSQVKRLENNSRMMQLFLNRRHLIHNGTISIILISQKYTLIPVKLRSNASWLILYWLNPIDLKNVYEDVIPLRKVLWDNLVEFVFGSEARLFDKDGD